MQRGRPLAKTAELYTFRLVTPEPYNRQQQVQLTQIESRLCAFQRAINQGRASPLTFPNLVQIPKFVVFRRNFDKSHEKSATKFHCLKTSSSKVVAQSTTYRTVSTFWQGMTPFPQNLDLKAPTPNKKDVRFRFHTRRAVQSAIADLLATILASNEKTRVVWEMASCLWRWSMYHHIWLVNGAAWGQSTCHNPFNTQTFDVTCISILNSRKQQSHVIPSSMRRINAYFRRSTNLYLYRT